MLLQLLWAWLFEQPTTYLATHQFLRLLELSEDWNEFVAVNEVVDSFDNRENLSLPHTLTGLSAAWRCVRATE